MKQSRKVICHFGMPSFRRCTILDGHLRVRPSSTFMTCADSSMQTLAAKHFGTRFVFVNVEKAPFMVTKMNVRLLAAYDRAFLR